MISNGKYDARADVWSLGITAIEMAQMRPPHHDMRPVLKVLFAIASGEPPGLENRDGFSPTFTAFIAHALTKDATERPTSAALLKHDFLQAARRDSLVPLIEKAQYFKANPRPKHRVSDASTATNASGTLRASGRTSIDDGSTIGGTFCAAGDTGTAEGTFCACSTADGGGGGGTLVGGWGGAFAGDRERRLRRRRHARERRHRRRRHVCQPRHLVRYRRRNSTWHRLRDGRRGAQHGRLPTGGTFVGTTPSARLAAEAMPAARHPRCTTAAAALARCASAPRRRRRRHPSHAPPIPRSPMAGRAAGVGRQRRPPAAAGAAAAASAATAGGARTRRYHTVKEGGGRLRSARALSLARGGGCARRRMASWRATPSSARPSARRGARVIPRAASDDALFERAVSTFREKGHAAARRRRAPRASARRAKRESRCRTEGDALRMAMAEAATT